MEHDNDMGTHGRHGEDKIVWHRFALIFHTNTPLWMSSSRAATLYSGTNRTGMRVDDSHMIRTQNRMHA